MSTGDIRARIAACAVFVFVPGALCLVWLVRTPPGELACFEQSTPARDAVMAQWLQGANLLLAGGALVVLGTLVLVSRWRGVPRRGVARAGRSTRVVAVIAPAYILACAIETVFFAVIAIVWLAAFVFWFVTVPCVLCSVALWLYLQPPGERVLPAMQALGWCALLAGIVGVGLLVAAPAIGSFCLD